MEPQYKNKNRLETKSFFKKKKTFVQEALFFGQLQPATQNPSPPPNPGQPLAVGISLRGHRGKSENAGSATPRPLRGHHHRSKNAGTSLFCCLFMRSTCFRLSVVRCFCVLSICFRISVVRFLLSAHAFNLFQNVCRSFCFGLFPLTPWANSPALSCTCYTIYNKDRQ
jgi:hypothetical protein